MIRKIRMVVVPILLFISLMMLIFSGTIIHQINTTYHFDEIITHTATVKGYENKNTFGRRGRTVYHTLVHTIIDDTDESVDISIPEPLIKLEQNNPIGSKIKVYEFHNRYSANLSSVLEPPSSYTIMWIVACVILFLITFHDYNFLFKN